MKPDLFVYWHAAPQAVKAALDAARDFQRALRRDHPEVVARLYRRSDAASEQLTVMETYCAPAGLGAAVQARIRDVAWCPGRRHVEVFEPAD